MSKLIRVACGMSGGVDSSVAAWLLRRKGYSVVGVFMQNWEVTDEDGRCTLDKDLEDAEFVCRKIGIPLVKVNFVREYWAHVFSELLREYEAGLTPNPDILCNLHIKFDAFYDYCRDRLGADAIAMGHYARTTFGTYLDNGSSSAAGPVKLLKARDTHKDQTFFLSRTCQKALRRCMFPVGDMWKSEVRSLATEAGFGPVAVKRDSTGICFVGPQNFAKFIDMYVERRPGKFVDIDTGQVVGDHAGIHQWTVGQRCNLGGHKKAYFVADKDTETQAIYVAAGTDHPALLSREMLADDPHWIEGVEPAALTASGCMECEFRFQHTQKLVSCRLTKTGTALMITLASYLRALTPGQYAVFYEDEVCLGSAKIKCVRLDDRRHTYVGFN